MNPQSPEQAGLHLPPPVGEQVPLGVPNPEQGMPHVERGAAGPERGGTSPQAPAAAVPAFLPLPVPPLLTPPPTAAQSANSVQPVAPTVADDGDLIEKEWVLKAKQIVERTKSDPYEQSKELTIFKADYMKKRYNKTIRLSE